MAQFHTVEEALCALQKGRIIMSQMTPTERTKEILSAQQSMPPPKTLILWRLTARG